MDVTWGVTGCFVPARGTVMESSNKSNKDGQNMTTARNDEGYDQEGGSNEGESFNPFARTSRVRRTPPRPRVDSCPDLKPTLSTSREERDKRKRSEANSPPSTTAAIPAGDKEPKTSGGDEVFDVEGSPSPGVSRERKKRKEPYSFSFRTTLDELSETTVPAMSNGLRQMMQKMEKLAGDLSYETKKNVNTKVEIKKLAREVDLMSQCLSRKLNKFCTEVARKLRKSSDKDTESVEPKRGTTQDAAAQTDPPPRKSKREGIKMITEAVTDEEILGAANKKWLEEWFEATTVRIGNPWNSPEEEDFAILLSASEAKMETGVARLLKDRFPEVARIEGMGSMKVTSTAQFGTEDPVTRSRHIHKGYLGGTTAAEILSALKTMKPLALQGSGVVAIPVPTGVDEETFRKLAELVFRKEKIRAVIHVPQRKGGKVRTPPTQRPPTGEPRRSRRQKDTEVLLIKQGDRSYTEMVKGLRTMVGANQEAKTIKEVRRTQDGRLLLAFKRGEPEMEELRRRIKESWEGAEVSDGGRRDSAKCTLHIKGFDDAVEDEEIKEALCGIAPSLQKETIEIGPRRPMHGGNSAVTVRVTGKDLSQLRGSRNKIRLGFNMCIVEERLEVMKCFRCWDFGHIAKNCKGPDRRAQCSRCGQEGHLAASCENRPYCLLCDTAGHRGGSGSCPKFREALLEKRATEIRVTAEPPPQDG